MCADKDKYSAPNPQFLQEVQKLVVKEIEEIRTVVDVKFRSQNEKLTNTYIQTQIVLPIPASDVFDGEFGLPPPFEDFTGREEELKLLRAGLDGEQVITQKIAGTGGIGKSQLANYFVREKRKSGRYDWVIWIRGAENDALTESQIQSQFVTLGNQLGIDIKQAQAGGILYKMVYQKLNQKGKGLIVMDDVPSYKAIQSFLPKTNGQVGMSVLLTTRNSQNFGPHIPSVLLSIFTLSDATNYIGKILGSKASEAAKIQLADTLGRYPLALTQALAYITSDEAMRQTPNEAISEYCQHYTQIRAEREAYLKRAVLETDPYAIERRAQNIEPVSRVGLFFQIYLMIFSILYTFIKYLGLLSGNASRAYQIEPTHNTFARQQEDKGEEATIWSVVQLSKKRIEERLSSIPHAYQHVCHVLKAASYLAPETGIAKDLLQKWAPEIGSEAGFKQIILETIERFSLLTQTTNGDYIMHQMVQDVLQLGDNEEAQKIFLSEVADYLCQHYEKTENPLADEARQNRLAPHLQAVWQHFEKRPQAKERYKKEAALLGFCLAHTNFRIGNPYDAVRYYKLIIEDFEKLYGPDHPNVIATLTNLASSTQELGDSVGAKMLLEKVLAIEERTNGPNTTRMAGILSNLGPVNLALGNPAEAKTLLERALFIQENTYGPDSHVLAKTLVNLANAIRELGDASGAKVIIEKALNIEETAYGPDNPFLAKTLTNLGIVMAELRDLAKAKTHLERALTIHKHTYGDGHPDQTMIMLNLGNVILELGDITKAKTLLKRALTIQEDAFGPSYPELARILRTLGNISVCEGEISGAKILYNRALAIEETNYGPDHPEVAKTLINLGIVASNLGDKEGAKTLEERALSIQEKTYGPDHPIAANTRFILGSTCFALKLYTSALEQFKSCIRVFYHHLGDEHPKTQKTREYIHITERLIIEQVIPRHLFSVLPHTLYDTLTQSNESNPVGTFDPKKMLLDRFNTNDPAQAIRQAIANGELSELSNLLQEFPDQANQPDQNHDNCFTALHLAVKGHKDKHVAVLLDCIGFTTTTDAKGCSALDYALQEDNTEILHHFRDALLKKYSQLKITPTQLPKLVRACTQNGDVSGLKLLMHLKVPCDEPGPTTGQTALHLAVIKSHLDCVKLLIAAKADPNKEDDKGQTPLSLSEDNPEICRELIANEEPESSTTAQTFH